MVDLFQLRTVTEGAFTTADENAHLDGNADIWQDSIEKPFENVLDDYIYYNGAYVANHSDDDGRLFWVAMVHTSTKNNDRVTIELNVQWLQTREGIYDSTYCLASIQRRLKKWKPWFGTVSVETVVVIFKSLTSRHRFPVSVHKKLRAQFSSMNADS